MSWGPTSHFTAGAVRPADYAALVSRPPKAPVPAKLRKAAIPRTGAVQLRQEAVHLNEDWPTGLEMLKGLQGLSVPGAEHNVAFLCQKFSGLINRLQVVEADSANEQKRSKVLQAKLNAALAELENDQNKRCKDLADARQEKKELSLQLSAIQAEINEREEELRTVWREGESLESKRAELDGRCCDEVHRANDASNRARQRDKARGEAEHEVRRLQSQMETLTVEFEATASELVGWRERAGREQTRLRELEALALDEERARKSVEETVLAQREELCSTLRQLACVKERVAGTEGDLQRCEEELLRREERHRALRKERQKREGQLLAAMQKAEGLLGVEADLENIVQDTVEVHRVLELERQEAKQSRANVQELQGALEEVQDKLQEKTSRLEEAEISRKRLQDDERNAQKELEASVSRLAQLEQDITKSSSVCQNLQSEIQLLVLETEAIRKEKEDVEVERNDLRRKLHLMGPSLAEAKRHCRELEDRAQAATADVEHERKLKEKLQREHDLCMEKARSAKQRYSQLTERTQALEEQFHRCAAPAQRRSQSQGRTTKKTGVSPGRPPRLEAERLQNLSTPTPSMGAFSRQQTPPQHAALPPSAAVPWEEPSTAQLLPTSYSPAPVKENEEQNRNSEPAEIGSLSQIRQWIEAEEARLGISPEALPVEDNANGDVQKFIDETLQGISLSDGDQLQ